MRESGLETVHKKDGSPVTNADLAADELLKATLSAARPEYGWLSEETVDDPARLAKTRLFVVDPIDGTRAFLNGRPWWSISIAVIEHQRPLAGVVFAPALTDTYAASIGAGATLNGASIQASSATELEDCAMTGNVELFSHPRWPKPWPAMRIRWRSSTALRMCLVASGRFDAAVVPAMKHDWDVAAGDLIAREAGCWVGDHHGRGFRYNGVKPAQASLVCAAPALAPLILERVRHIGQANT
jgi:myo-inositol-1(or 4)-monophosphatase